MGKYESSAIAEAVAHQRAETKIIAFTGFAYRDIAPELFPKLRVPTGIYHNPVQVPDKREIGRESTCTVTALIRWDEKAGLHGMRYAPRIDVLYAQEKETGDEED